MITSENVRGAVSNLFQKGMSVAWVIRKHKTEVEYVNFIFFNKKTALFWFINLLFQDRSLGCKIPHG